MLLFVFLRPCIHTNIHACIARLSSEQVELAAIKDVDERYKWLTSIEKKQKRQEFESNLQRYQQEQLHKAQEEERELQKVIVFVYSFSVSIEL